MAISLGVLVLLPYAHPSLERFRLLTQGVSVFGSDEEEPAPPPPAPEVVGEAALPGPTDDQQSRGDELSETPNTPRGPIANAKPLPIPVSLSEDKPPHFIDDPGALEKFFAKLVRVEQKEPGAIARIVYYGDSIVASDFITGKLRRLLQDRFGDAGHGYAMGRSMLAKHPLGQGAGVWRWRPGHGGVWSAHGGRSKERFRGAGARGIHHAPGLGPQRGRAVRPAPHGQHSREQRSAVWRS